MKIAEDVVVVSRIISIDDEKLKNIRELLHGLNNHAVVVCGYLDMGIKEDRILQIVKKSSLKIHDLLSKLSTAFQELQNDTIIQDDEGAGTVSSE